MVFSEAQNRLPLLPRETGSQATRQNPRTDDDKKDSSGYGLSLISAHTRHCNNAYSQSHEHETDDEQ